MNKNGDALVAFRLEQSDESLESARILLDHEKYRPSVSRSYYAMFYAVLALLPRKTTGYPGIPLQSLFSTGNL